MSILYSDCKQRFLDLIGQPNGTISDFGSRNINRAVRDILNKYKFSWNLKTDDLTLSSGTANLPSDYNPVWHIDDARITASGQDDDHVFCEIFPSDRDSYTSDDYVYWITYDPINQLYVFNSLTQTGTVTIYYNFVPSDMSSDSDKCVIPDLEALSYLAASKNWVGAERDVDLKREYEAEAEKYITALYVSDGQFGPALPQNSLAQDNLSAYTSFDDRLIVEV